MFALTMFMFLVLTVVNCVSNPALSFEDMLKAYTPEECPTPCPSPTCPAPNLSCPKLSYPTRATTQILAKMRIADRKIRRLATPTSKIFKIMKSVENIEVRYIFTLELVRIYIAKYIYSIAQN